MEHILSLLIFFPAVAATLGFFVHQNAIRLYVLIVAVAEFLLSLLLWFYFDTSSGLMQFVQSMPLISSYGITYNVGVDGISLFLVILSTFMTLIAVIASNEKNNIKPLLLTMLYLEMALVAVFLSLDAIVFYIFWELSLIPMFYIIGAWGGEKRVYTALKFFLYTFTGSLIMLVGMIYLGYVYFTVTGHWSFSLQDWTILQLPFTIQCWLFVAFFFGFAIKVPIVPFHRWLIFAHKYAPTIGSVILASIVMGTYGFIRFSLPLFPDATLYFVDTMAILALLTIIYTAMIAYAQKDVKQVIAYASVSHMGMIVLGTFALNVEGISGAIFLMVSHGIVSGALFMLVGSLSDRMNGSVMIDSWGGLAHDMPKMATLFGVMLMASIGLPLTIGFVGEFLSLMGFFKVSPWITAIAGMTIVLSAVYMLVVYKKLFLGPSSENNEERLYDLKGREKVALIPLVALVIFLGVYPKLLLDPIDISVTELLRTMHENARFPQTKQRILELNTVGEIVQ